MTLDIREIEDGDLEAVPALWQACGLTMPYNDPQEDIALCRDSGHGTILCGFAEEELIATAMVGHDGHRGWLYYVAVSPDHQGKKYGADIMEAAEAWLEERNVPKAELIVRAHNKPVQAFYESIGYKREPHFLMVKWLGDNEGHLPDFESTIVYLEMQERPTIPTVHPPAGKKVSLIRAEEPTVSFYRYLYNTVGEEWLWFERRMMDDETLLATIREENTSIYVLYVDGTPAGFGELMQVPEEDAVDIHYFGLLPDYIGAGLGWYFINAMIDFAWASSPSKVTVNTCDLDHPRALGNYQKAGFKPVATETVKIPDTRVAGLAPPPPVSERHHHHAGHPMKQAADDNNVIKLAKH